MNPLTTHLHKQGVTYLEHWCFAMGIAYRLGHRLPPLDQRARVRAARGAAVYPIEPRLDLEATTAYLAERNQWIERAKDTVHGDAKAGLAIFN